MPSRNSSSVSESLSEAEGQYEEQLSLKQLSFSWEQPGELPETNSSFSVSTALTMLAVQIDKIN